MSKNKRKQPVKPASPMPKQTDRPDLPALWPWIAGACVVTALAFMPMLQNGFTNWDDQFYITENTLLPGPDWAGIFSEPVVSNYHPLTMASLAFNYQVSALSPGSYHFVNWMLHLLNVALVFLLAYQLSDKKTWVAFLTALFFGIHPMHVESVAWASERKDVLFTCFFLASLIWYGRYLAHPGRKAYAITLGLFALSLLSKPAAVTLPVCLLLIDWYRGRSLQDGKVWLEKLPFFGLALLFGVLTLQFQAEKAIANPEYYPWWQRVAFAVYGFGEYLLRLFWPAPLSAIHPMPNAGIIPAAYYPALIISILTLAGALYFRKNKPLLFGLGFFAVNLALVLQLLPFGNAIIAERYTYVPYFGLLFALFMIWSEAGISDSTKKAALGVFLTAALIFAWLSNRQVRVWKDSLTLWNHAVEVYPDSYIARANRANYYLTNLKQYDKALTDYTVALKTEPDDAHSLENRTVVYLHLENYPAALADAEQFVRLYPEKPRAYLLRAFTQEKLKNIDQAIADYGKCIELDPKYEEPHSNRGVIYYNSKKDYAAAKADFDEGIRLNPKKGVNYVNRARCWVKSGNKANALADIATARSLGEPVGEELVRAAEGLQ